MSEISEVEIKTMSKEQNYLRGYSDGKSDTLDKIRAEIEGMYRVILKGTPKDDWAVKWNDCLDEVLEIFDKCKAESEGEGDANSNYNKQ